MNVLEEPLFTVIIPLYNNENYIVNTVKSVLEQTCQSFEIIIIDDKSTDNSLEVVNTNFSSQPKIHIYQNPVNIGVYRTQNRGLELSRGKYICVLGSDDIFEPKRLAEDKKNLETYDFVMCKYDRKFLNGKINFSPRYGGSMITFKKEVIKEIGPWLNLRFSGDTEFQYRIENIYHKKILRCPLVLYHSLCKDDNTNLTSIHNKTPRNKVKKYYKLLHEYYCKRPPKEIMRELLDICKQVGITKDEHEHNLKVLKIKTSKKCRN